MVKVRSLTLIRPHTTVNGCVTKGMEKAKLTVLTALRSKEPSKMMLLKDMGLKIGQVEQSMKVNGKIIRKMDRAR